MDEYNYNEPIYITEYNQPCYRVRRTQRLMFEWGTSLTISLVGRPLICILKEKGLIMIASNPSTRKCGICDLFFLLLSEKPFVYSLYGCFNKSRADGLTDASRIAQITPYRNRLF